MRITTQLVDATTGHHLWADRFDREVKDVFALQDEIAKKVVQTVAGYSVKPMKAGTAREFHEGIGVVTGVDLAKGRLVVDHEEIKDFMAAHEMSYQVRPTTLLEGLELGQKVRFTIDADERIIVDITRFRD